MRVAEKRMKHQAQTLEGARLNAVTVVRLPTGTMNFDRGLVVQSGGFSGSWRP